MDILTPVKSLTIVIRPNAPWYYEDTCNKKRKRHRLQLRWRSSRLGSDRCSVVNTMLYKVKEFIRFNSSVIQDNADDTRLIFRSTDKLLHRQTENHYPSADNDQQLAITLADSFASKIEGFVRSLFLGKVDSLTPLVWLSRPAVMVQCF